MTKKLIIVLLLTISSLYNTVISQTLNWSTIENSKHIISAGIGWDYSLTYSVGYGHKLNSKIPIVLHLNLSAPLGDKAFDDFKTKIGGQVCLFNKSNFMGSVSVFGIYRRYQNELVQIQNFGSELKGTFGYYKPKWFLASEIGFDKAIVSHFKHSKTYRENIFSDVKDGWYEPATGGNFYYGIQTGYSFKKSDLTLTIDKIITQDFKTTPTVPFYIMLGYNKRID